MIIFDVMLIASMMAAASGSGYEKSNLMIFLMGYTVVVYLVTAQILAVVSSLLIYSVRFLCCNTMLLFYYRVHTNSIIYC